MNLSNRLKSSAYCLGWVLAPLYFLSRAKWWGFIGFSLLYGIARLLPRKRDEMLLASLSWNIGHWPEDWDLLEETEDQPMAGTKGEEATGQNAAQS